MSDDFRIGDRVEIHLNEKTWGDDGWFAGKIVRIEPYSEHRRFYWVELNDNENALPGKGATLISVLNPRNIRKA